MNPSDQSEATIIDHTLYSMAGALIPIPLVDIGTVAAIQLNMIQRICTAYEVRYDRERGRAIVTSLVGASLPKVGASAFKVLPGIGTLLGSFAQAVLSGASTYAIGEVFRYHFERGGSVADLDPQRVSELYRDYFEKGKEVAESLRDQLTATRSTSDDSLEALTRSLVRLERLRATGALTQEEFDQLKDTALRKREE